MGHSVGSIAWQRFRPCIVIFGLTLLAYAPALTGTFVFGDAEQVTPPELRTLLGLQRIWFEPGATAHYAPLLHTVFWLEYQLWGDAVLGYHLASVLQHALAACLVLALVRRLELPGGFLAGILFALHPVGVESVAWISQQANTLSAVFYLGAALIYVGFDRERIMWQYDVALGLFVLALLTKTATATLPAALLSVFWWERGRLDWRRDAVPLLPWFALAIGAATFTAWLSPGLNATDLARLIQRPDLIFIDPRTTLSPAIIWSYAFPWGALALGIGLAVFARRQRAAFAGFLFFSITLLPELGFGGFEIFGSHEIASHAQYLAILGIIMPAAIGLTMAGHRLSAARRGALAMSGAAIVIGVLGALTGRHGFLFRDGETLYRHTLAHRPQSWLAHNHLGEILAQKADGLPEALTHYRRALALKPDYATAHANVGDALAKIPGELPRALIAYDTSLQLHPDVADVRVRYADALAQMPARLSEAVAEYHTALSLAPDHTAGHYHLGRTLERIPGRSADAIAAYEKAVRLKPDYLDAYRSLGDALAGNPARVLDAIAAYEGALHVAPGDLQIRSKLAAILARIPERAPQAIAEYQRVLQYDPDHAEARDGLAALLAASKTAPKP